MAKPFIEELVYAVSEDGFPLEGAVIQPAEQPPRPLALLWVHGLTGRFYAPGSVRIGRAVAARGYRFITGNNRGHDFGAVLRRQPGDQPTIGGGAWELFDESPRDIAGWIDFATGLGHARVVLLGHSLGALKVGYYQARRHDPRVAGLIAASPPLRAGRVDPALLAQAERLVAEGRGRDLLPWGVTPAGGGTLSAQSYLNRARTNIDVYGFATPAPAIAGVRCPLLAFYGTDEAWVGTAADLEVIRAGARQAARVDTFMVEGADHSYTGREQEVASRVADWLDTLG